VRGHRGLLAGAAVGVFPVMLQSTLAPEHHRRHGAGPAHGLAVALIWWPVALVLALAYLTVVMRNQRKVARARSADGIL
jgi:hypothetical protein